MSSNARMSSKTRRDTKLSDVIIRKPFISEKLCPLSIRTKRPCVPAKKSGSKSTDKSQSSMESFRSLIKYGIKDVEVKDDSSGEPIRMGSKGPRTIFRADSVSEKHLSVDKNSSGLETIQTLEDPYGSLKSKVADRDNAFLHSLYSEAVGPSKCQFLFSVPTSEIKFEEVSTLEKKIEPSHALKNWERWLKRKKVIQKHLSKSINKKPCDLLINRLEVFRQVLEDKTMLTYAQIPKADKWRGHPNRWKLPGRLGPENQESEYLAVKTKLERGVKPQMEFLGVPVVIQRESKLVCFDAPKSVNVTAVYWESSDYRRIRCQEFKKELKMLKPHSIQFEELAVVGTRLFEKNKDKKLSLLDSEVGPILPKIFVTDFDEGIHDNEVVIVSKVQKDSSRQSHCTLVIEGEEISIQVEPLCVQTVEKTCKRCNWVVDFGPNLVGSFVEKSIKVENRGTMGISYEWVLKKVCKNEEIDLVSAAKQEPWLFFNKNPGVFIPGQIYNLKFYHQSKSPGIRSETWYLKTHPDLFGETDNGKITFSALDVVEPIDHKFRTLENYLKKRVGESIVKALLDYILLVITVSAYNIPKIEYRSFFLEKDLFEYHNPRYYYHSAIVQQLKDLFLKIPSTKGKEWDFSLDSLLTLVKMSPHNVQNTLLCELSSCAKALLRPFYLGDVMDEKYWITYQILCKVTNFMEEDFKYFKNQSLNIQKTFCLTDYGGEESQSSIQYRSMYLDDEELSNSIEAETEEIVNFSPYRTMFYLKVYRRLVEAVEMIADSLDTLKLFVPRKKKYVV